MQQHTSGPDHLLLGQALSEYLSWLQQHPSIDPGGQCKRRIHQLIGE